MYKLLFTFTLLVSITIAISSYSWMGMWMGLEMNLLSIMPLINNKSNFLNSETSIKYFIVQALASTTLMFSILLFSMNWDFNLSTFLFNSSLLMKMGAAPFHFWFPEILEGLNWINTGIMMTIQKIAPMILIVMNSYLFISMIIMFSMFISSTLGLNQISLRKIMAYSSINHIGWMLAALLFMKTVWLMYFSIYLIISWNLVLFFKKFNINYINHLISYSNNSYLKILFMMNLLSLGGLPPFLGFFPKWMIMQLLIKNNFYLLSFMMIMMTLIPLYFYMRLTFSSLTMINNNLNYKTIYLKNLYPTMIFNMIALNSLIICTMLMNLD
uniref:NADH-ubiquinone oxidoreductase chain 2 n=1 Tax=Espanoliella jeanneli TaxID=723344 RepID=A0A0S2M766_9COLE|nr:NADH deshydrogenase subunit 2 [Espanoliella jeanneli]